MHIEIIFINPKNINLMETTSLNLIQLQTLLQNNPIYIISEHGLESWKPSQDVIIQEIELDDTYDETIPGNEYPQAFTLFIYPNFLTVIIDLFENLEVNFNLGADNDFYDYRPDQLLCILRCLELLKDYQGIDHKGIALYIINQAEAYQKETPDLDPREFEITYDYILDQFKKYL